jgi:hypothetical protein
MNALCGKDTKVNQWLDEPASVEAYLVAAILVSLGVLLGLIIGG